MRSAVTYRASVIHQLEISGSTSQGHQAQTSAIRGSPTIFKQHHTTVTALPYPVSPHHPHRPCPVPGSPSTDTARDSPPSIILSQQPSLDSVFCFCLSFYSALHSRLGYWVQLGSLPKLYSFVHWSSLWTSYTRRVSQTFYSCDGVSTLLACGIMFVGPPYMGTVLATRPPPGMECRAMGL